MLLLNYIHNASKNSFLSFNQLFLCKSCFSSCCNNTCSRATAFPLFVISLKSNIPNISSNDSNIDSLFNNNNVEDNNNNDIQENNENQNNIKITASILRELQRA